MLSSKSDSKRQNSTSSVIKTKYLEHAQSANCYVQENDWIARGTAWATSKRTLIQLFIID